MKLAKKIQSGFTLIEMAMVTLVMGILLSAGAMVYQNHVDDDNKKAIAQELLEAQSALVKYATHYHDNLTSQIPSAVDYPALPVNLYAPTYAELKTQGYLDNNQSDVYWSRAAIRGRAVPSPHSIIGASWIFQINKVPAGCVNSDCDLEMVTTFSIPVTKNASLYGTPDVDENYLATIAKFGGGKIGYSTLANPAVVIGPNQSWTTANPVVGQPAGILLARSSFNSMGLAHYVRVMDSRKLVVGGNLTVANDTLLDDAVVHGTFNNIGNTVSTGLVSAKEIVTGNIVTNTPTTMATPATNTIVPTWAVPQQPCGPVGSTGIALTGELYTCRYHISMGGYWILASEPDCQLPTTNVNTIYTNFGSQSILVSMDQNLQIPVGCFFAKFEFSDSVGNFNGTDFMTFNRSNPIDGQVVQSYFTMFSNMVIVMDKNQQIIAHQRVGTIPSKYIRLTIAKD